MQTSWAIRLPGLSNSTKSGQEEIYLLAINIPATLRRKHRPAKVQPQQSEETNKALDKPIKHHDETKRKYFIGHKPERSHRLCRMIKGTLGFASVRNRCFFILRNSKKASRL
ncbi:hypothetical protein CDAR_503381 [Caerostris darwini]|uniref:Uncharacterized protein n=1 Tax=Caerostris darwini TaxID=1538125 RepID=A0AAV4NZX8_9ARAC|nr:hypothetical protein CDAR_503311 [Caerostris darwini]GIX89300.1 hypothetical protein CDAR_503381 [Caerostris darwini]